MQILFNYFCSLYQQSTVCLQCPELYKLEDQLNYVYLKTNAMTYESGEVTLV